jgi:chromosome segregation ATPase
MENQDQTGQGSPPQDAQEAQTTETESVDKNTPVNVGEQPENVQHLIRSLRSEAQQRREANEALMAKLEKIESEQSKAEEDRLANNQEWEKLAKQREEKIKEIMPTLERVEKLESALNATIDAQLKEIPQEMHTLMMHLDDPLDKLAWLTENLPKLKKSKTPPLDGGRRSEVTPGNKPTYKPRKFRRY